MKPANEDETLRNTLQTEQARPVARACQANLPAEPGDSVQTGEHRNSIRPGALCIRRSIAWNGRTSSAPSGASPTTTGARATTHWPHAGGAILTSRWLDRRCGTCASHVREGGAVNQSACSVVVVIVAFGIAIAAVVNGQTPSEALSQTASLDAASSGPAFAGRAVLTGENLTQLSATEPVKPAAEQSQRL